MSTCRLATVTVALALFTITAAPLPQLLGPAPAAAQTADEVLADQTPLTDLDNKALRARVKALRDLMATGDLTRDKKREVRASLKEARTELKARREARKNSETDQAAPQTADEVLADQTPLTDLNIRALRARVKALRDLMATGDLTRDKKREVRASLQEARTELKARREARKNSENEQEDDSSQSESDQQ